MKTNNQQKQAKQVPRGNPSELKASLDNADKIKEEVKIDSFKLLLEHRYCRNCDVILRNEDKEYCENCLRLIQQTNEQATADFIKMIKKDIMLFEDARDILINLKEQGVGTGDCEELFDKRVIELKQMLVEK